MFSRMNQAENEIVLLDIWQRVAVRYSDLLFESNLGGQKSEHLQRRSSNGMHFKMSEFRTSAKRFKWNAFQATSPTTRSSRIECACLL